MSKTPKPPHLPPQSSSLRQRRALETLPWLFVFLALTALVATTVSTAFLAWYVPDFVSYQVPVQISDRPAVPTSAAIDPLLSRSIEERSVSLYRSATTGATALAADQFIAHAVVLSSDGLIAFAGVGHSEPLSALDADGVLHAVTITSIDRINDITYANIDEGNFLVAGVSQWEQPMFGRTLWLLADGSWHRATVSDRIDAQSIAAFDLSLPLVSYGIDFAMSGMLFTDAGVFVGFANSTFVTPSWHVRQAIPALLAGTSTHTTSASGYVGTLLEAYQDPDSGVFVDTAAIRIDRIPAQPINASTTLQVGDILTRIESAPVQPHDLARQLELSPASLRATVLRGGVYESVVLTP